MKNLYLLFLLVFPLFLSAQVKEKWDYDPKTESVYKVNRWASAGIAFGGLAIGSAGVDQVRDKPRLSQEELDGLSEDNVLGIDRWALRQDVAIREDAEGASDIIFNAAAVLPLTLFVSKKFRKDWIDITLVYLEAHAINMNMYAWSPLGATFIDRLRPVAYYSEIDPGFRGLGNSRNSFFSGHVSTTATGTFFFTKVLSDYNPQWTGGQRALAFSLAALPPVYVAVKRVQSLKHFPTDTAVGILVGAASGVLAPQLHKNWQRKHRTRLSVSGSYGDGVGAGGLVLTF